MSLLEFVHVGRNHLLSHSVSLTSNHLGLLLGHPLGLLHGFVIDSFYSTLKYGLHILLHALDVSNTLGLSLFAFAFGFAQGLYACLHCVLDDIRSKFGTSHSSG